MCSAASVSFTTGARERWISHQLTAPSSTKGTIESRLVSEMNCHFSAAEDPEGSLRCTSRQARSREMAIAAAKSPLCHQQRRLRRDRVMAAFHSAYTPPHGWY